MPDKAWAAVGLSSGFIIASFFLAGFHWETKHRLRERRRGGWL